jgi:hypothetical protein
MRKRFLVAFVSLAAMGLSGCDSMRGTGPGFYPHDNLMEPTPMAQPAGPPPPTTESSGQGFFANLFAPPPPSQPAGPPPNPTCVRLAKQRAAEATYSYPDIYDAVFNRVYAACNAQPVYR